MAHFLPFSRMIGSWSISMPESLPCREFSMLPPPPLTLASAKEGEGVQQRGKKRDGKNICEICEEWGHIDRSLNLSGNCLPFILDIFLSIDSISIHFPCISASTRSSRAQRFLIWWVDSLTWLLNDDLHRDIEISGISFYELHTCPPFLRRINHQLKRFFLTPNAWLSIGDVRPFRPYPQAFWQANDSTTFPPTGHEPYHLLPPQTTYLLLASSTLNSFLNEI